MCVLKFAFHVDVVGYTRGTLGGVCHLKVVTKNTSNIAL